jgi:triosephosphate isomerase
MRRQIAAGNWKMNTNLHDGMQLASEVIHMMTSENIGEVDMILFVPFPHLTSIGKQIGETSGIFLGAQNCHDQPSGAYTGEVSAEMLQSIGVNYVLVGHSERREYFQESHELLARKIDIVLEHGMKPTFCCGEKLETREAGQHFELVEKQVRESICHLKPQQLRECVIAYEPVWAIGTGKTATAEQAEEMHAHIRKVLSEAYDETLAEAISILYGGRVKAGNAQELFAKPNVDGGLVGGASLKSRDFVDIAKSFA